MKTKTQTKPHTPSPVKPVAISFDGFRLVEVNFSVNENFKGKAGEKTTTNVDIESAYHFDRKSRGLKALLGIKMGGKSAQYSLSVKCMGAFTLSEDPKDDKRLDHLAMINCPAILFPYLRETVADITRRAGFRVLHLQPVNFVRLYFAEEKLKLEKLEKKKKRKAPSRKKTKSV